MKLTSIDQIVQVQDDLHPAEKRITHNLTSQKDTTYLKALISEAKELRRSNTDNAKPLFEEALEISRQLQLPRFEIQSLLDWAFVSEWGSYRIFPASRL